MSVNQNYIGNKLSVGGLGSNDLTLALFGTDGVLLPKGPTAQRPTGVSLLEAVLRYNTDDNALEWYNGTTWIQLVTSDTYVSAITFSTFNGVLTLARTEGMPDLTVDLDGRFVPLTTTLTINGTTQDLSTNRTFTLTTSSISEGTNLYFTNARARSAISLTTTGTSGAATYNSSTGVLNVPQYAGGTVFNFSAGDLAPLFTTTETNTTTTPALAFSLSNAAANSYFGNATGSSAAPSYTTAGALTKTDDTNVTLTLGGNPSTALLRAASITVGWTGSLSLARGGTGASLSDPNADRILFWDDSAGTIAWLTVSTGLVISGTSLTSSITQYTDAMARAAISLTTTGSSGPATYNSTTGVLNIPDYAGGGGVADNPLTVVSSATSLTLTTTGSYIKTYVFTGSADTTWTLPAVGTTGQIIKVKNRGTANITLQTAGANQIYGNSAVTSILVLTGNAFELQDDGTYWILNG